MRLFATIIVVLVIGWSIYQVGWGGWNHPPGWEPDRRRKKRQ